MVNDDAKKKERKNRGKELTQTPWTLRMDNANMTWLENESEKTGIARGRIVNNLIETAREQQAPTTTRWKMLEKKLRDLQLGIMELAKSLGNAIDDSKSSRDEDAAPDTLNSMMDAKA